MRLSGSEPSLVEIETSMTTTYQQRPLLITTDDDITNKKRLIGKSKTTDFVRDRDKNA